LAFDVVAPVIFILNYAGNKVPGLHACTTILLERMWAGRRVVSQSPVAPRLENDPCGYVTSHVCIATWALSFAFQLCQKRLSVSIKEEHDGLASEHEVTYIPQEHTTVLGWLEQSTKLLQNGTAKLEDILSQFELGR
jgi:hypothetical protein